MLTTTVSPTETLTLITSMSTISITFTEITEITETMLIFIMVYTKAGEQEGWVTRQDGIHNLDLLGLT